MSDKTYTAEELRSNKTRAMTLAYSGETVRITNVRFPGGHFELRFVRPVEILTDEEKRAKIKELTGFSSAANTHIKFHFIDDLPGYVILSSHPDIITGEQKFRCINYEMRNFFADTFDECVQKARDYAAKHEVAKCK